MRTLNVAAKQAAQATPNAVWELIFDYHAAITMKTPKEPGTGRPRPIPGQPTRQAAAAWVFRGTGPHSVEDIDQHRYHAIGIELAEYQAFLDKIRGHDDVSFALVVDLLAAETHRRADPEAALAQPSA